MLDFISLVIGILFVVFIIGCMIILAYVIYKLIKKWNNPEYRQKIIEENKERRRLNKIIQEEQVIEATIKNEKSSVVLIKQILETIYILQTTKNYKTYISRYNFLEGKAYSFDELSKKYNKDIIVKAGIKIYQNMYYDRQDVSNMMEYLIQPYLDMSKILEDTIPNFIVRYTIEKNEEIDKLKTQKAKENRKMKMKNEENEILEFLKQLGYTKTDLELIFNEE